MIWPHAEVDGVGTRSLSVYGVGDTTEPLTIRLRSCLSLKTAVAHDWRTPEDRPSRFKESHCSKETRSPLVTKAFYHFPGNTSHL